MLIMYETGSGFQPTRHYELTQKPKSLSWKKLNRESWEGNKHWLCFYLPDVKKTFNVYYPVEAIRGEKIQLLINTNEDVGEFFLSLYRVEWIEGKLGLFENEIKPRLIDWVVKMSNKNEEAQPFTARGK